MNVKRSCRSEVKYNMFQVQIKDYDFYMQRIENHFVTFKGVYSLSTWSILYFAYLTQASKKVICATNALSYKFGKGFLAITFSLLVFTNWNFHDVCQRFLYNQEQNISWIRQKMRNFPIDPIVKIAHFCNIMTLQKWAIIIMGVYEEISQFLSDPTEILFLVI